MKLKINKITTEELKLQIHHIGGIGDCGPLQVLESLNEYAAWTFYDADKTALETISGYEDKEYRLILKCIGGTDSIETFNITKEPSASSLLKPAESAKDYIVPGQETTWGEQTEIIDTKKVKVHRLDTLVNKGEIAPIDFISIDAQGAELDILNGTDLTDTVGIICELEFSHLYENQPLIFDIHKKLYEDGFRFCHLFNPQVFKVSAYPDSLGFLTVCEGLFFKNPTELLKLEKMDIEERTKSVIKLLKLASVTICYNQTDFAMTILNKLDKQVSLKEIAKQSKNSCANVLLDIMKVLKDK